MQGRSSEAVSAKPTHTRQPKVKGLERTAFRALSELPQIWRLPTAPPNCAPNGGTTPTPTPTLMTTGIASLLINSTSQTLLPLPALVTAIAQSTTSSVERVLDQHFTSLLRQQQQLVSAVQQLARPQVAVSLSSLSSNPPTGPPSSTLARGPPGNPQLQIPPATILRSIPLITSAPVTINSSLLLVSSSAGNSRMSVPSGLAATPIPAVAELPGPSAPVGIVHTPGPTEVSGLNMEG